jgi:hypothetical protein
MRLIVSILSASIVTLLLIGEASAAELREEGKLLLTGGVSNVEGVGGGGLSNWAVITGDETRDGVGANAHATEIGVSDFQLATEGAAVGLFDRVEFSYAHQRFDTSDAGAKLGLGKGYAFSQDIVGAKIRLAGELVYDQDTWLPQISAGVEYKRADRDQLVKALGAKASDGVDYYISATKLILSQSLLLSGTVRATRANQFGLLGFGGDKDGNYSPEFEGAAALLLTRKLAVGAEYRTKPDNLGFAREDNAWSAFAAYAFDKHLSFTLAYVDLGDIATFKNQRGVYASIQAGF